MKKKMIKFLMKQQKILSLFCYLIDFERISTVFNLMITNKKLIEVSTSNPYLFSSPQFLIFDITKEYITTPLYVMSSLITFNPFKALFF
jgi:hypothetical protein